MMNLEQSSIYIESANWIVAKSYADTAPHQYNLLQDSDLDSFNAFCGFVNSHLVREPFYKTWFYYCYIGEYKYWTMEKVGEQPRLINRARIENKY